MSDNIPEWTFHPILIGNIFASRFRSILFKSEIWLEEKYGKSYELHSRVLPPWYTYPETGPNLQLTGAMVPKLIDFKYPMNWPPFVHSEGGMLRAQFALDHLWDIWYGTDVFYFGPSPEGYGPGKAMFASKKVNLRTLQDKVLGYLEVLKYERDISEEEVEDAWEDHVFKEYYFNSLYGRDALYGPLRACNHRATSGLLFKKKDLDVPVYNGINYFRIKRAMASDPPYKPEKYFYHCISIPGVVLSSASHTIDIPRHAQITVNYTGVGRAKKKGTLTGKDQTPAPVQDFPMEKEDWCYPVEYAARGRLYFNETSEDNDYIDTLIDESELIKDGCTTIPDPYFPFPETPEGSDDGDDMYNEGSGDDMYNEGSGDGMEEEINEEEDD
jgi:hypothetical protein